MKLKVNPKFDEMLIHWAEAKVLSVDEFMEELITQFQFRHTIEPAEEETRAASREEVKNKFIADAFQSLSVEKTGKVKIELFGFFLEHLKTIRWYYHVCEFKGIKFLIVSEKEFAEEDINLETPGGIRLLRVDSKQVSAWIYDYHKQVKIFWFDYGYFVF